MIQWDRRVIAVAEGKVGLSDYRREGDLPSNDVETGNQFNYSGQVLHMGPLDGYDPAAGGLSLTPRRYAVRRGLTIPKLSEVREIDPAVMGIEPVLRKR